MHTTSIVVDRNRAVVQDPDRGPSSSKDQRERTPGTSVFVRAMDHPAKAHADQRRSAAAAGGGSQKKALSARHEETITSNHVGSILKRTSTGGDRATTRRTKRKPPFRVSIFRWMRPGRSRFALCQRRAPLAPSRFFMRGAPDWMATRAGLDRSARGGHLSLPISRKHYPFISSVSFFLASIPSFQKINKLL